MFPETEEDGLLWETRGILPILDEALQAVHRRLDEWGNASLMKRALEIRVLVMDIGDISLGHHASVRPGKRVLRFNNELPEPLDVQAQLAEVSTALMSIGQHKLAQKSLDLAYSITT